MGKKSFNYTIFFAIGNFAVFVVIYTISIIFVIKIIDILILRILLIGVLYFACSFLELKILIRVVNPAIEFFLPESYKKEKELNVQEYREFLKEMSKKKR